MTLSKNKILLLLLGLIILFCASISYGAEPAANSQGKSNQYYYDYKNRTLTIYGDGYFDTFEDAGSTCYITKYGWLPNLEKVVMEDGVTMICEGAFSGCTKLKEVELPDSIRYIGKNAFADCESLREIRIPEGVQNIEANTFSNCLQLETIHLPNRLCSLGYHAFRGCESLKSLEIPANVTHINPNDLFEGCYSLEKITVNPENPVLYAVDGVLFSRAANNSNHDSLEEQCGDKGDAYTPEDNDKTALIRFPPAKKDTEYVVPDGVNILCRGAFRNLNQMEKVYIPHSVTTLQVNPFDSESEYKIIYDGTRLEWNVMANDMNNGSGCYYGSISRNRIICKKALDINFCNLPKIPDRTWTGTKIKVKDKPFVYDEQAKVKVTYKNNINVGNATVIYQGTGAEFKGSAEVQFRILPQGTKIVKTQEVKKGAIVTWKKQFKQVDGFQIQFATDKKFQKNKKSFTAKDNKAIKKVCKGLKGKKKYYVRIRTYKTAKGEKYCSKWSSARVVVPK